MSRLALLTAGVALVVAACGTGLVSPTPSIAAASPTTESGSRAPSASAANPSTLTPSPSPDPVPPAIAGGVFEAMLAAITAHRPTYRFQLEPDRLDGDWRLIGEADDGFGPGRLFIDLTETPGALTANPCLDRDFTQGSACVQRTLGNGARLFLRDVVEANGTSTVLVVLIHSDQSGISAEASTGSIRPRPLYTVTELAELVIAIERGLQALSDR